jgi:hypothetical protein
LTPEQNKLFVEIAQTGITCGLEHPYEWFVNYERSLSMLHPWSEVEKLYQEALKTYVEFFKGTMMCGETLTELELIARMNQWYARRGKMNSKI